MKMNLRGFIKGRELYKSGQELTTVENKLCIMRLLKRINLQGNRTILSLKIFSYISSQEIFFFPNQICSKVGEAQKNKDRAYSRTTIFPPPFHHLSTPVKDMDRKNKIPCSNYLTQAPLTIRMLSNQCRRLCSPSAIFITFPLRHVTFSCLEIRHDGT
jgi:hypothetical protein